MLKKKTFLTQGYIVVLAGVVLFTTACGAQQTLQPISATEQVKTATDNVIEAAGKIKAKDTRNIILDFPAAVLAIPVEDGQRVTQGEELVTLDIYEIQQQIQDKQNALAIERLQLEKLQNDINNNAALEASALQTAQEELKRANEDLANKKALFEAGAISKLELDTAQYKVDDAQRKVADKQISQANANKLNLQMEQQKVSTLESDLKRLQDKLNKSYIQGDKVISDVQNGLIQESTHIAGDYVPANSKLLNLVNMDSLIVEADVPENLIKDVQVGAEVEIQLLADSTKVYKGHVQKIADRGVDKNGETVVATEISIDNGDEFVKPDFSVDVRITKVK